MIFIIKVPIIKILFFMGLCEKNVKNERKNEKKMRYCKYLTILAREIDIIIY